MRGRLEGSIQRSVVEYAKKRGLLAKKLSVQGPMGNIGWPDYMFLGCKPVRHVQRGTNEYEADTYYTNLQSIIFFIEFKAPGKDLTPLQKEVRKKLVEYGFMYHTVDDSKKGKVIIDDALR